MLTRFQARGLDALGVSPRRIAVVPLAVSNSRFAFHARRLEPPFVLIHVANAHPIKGTHVLLETFQHIRSAVPARLVIVGAGHIGGMTEREVERRGLGDDVRLVAPVLHEELAEHYRAAHCLLHTSWYESQGVVFNEAMASGAVVCATEVGLASDLSGRCCVTAPVGEPRELAQSVLELLSDEQRYLELQARALAWSREHDVRWSASRYREVYRELGSR